MNPLGVEDFLAQFHDARPGLTSQAFADWPVQCAGATFASSYEALAAGAAGAQRVLDLACGDGWLLAILQRQGGPGRTLAGLDMSRGELRAAQQRLGHGVTLLQGRAQSLPFADGAFDAVTSHLALMLMDEIEAVLAEVRRVLRPGGQLLAIVGTAQPPSVARSVLMDLLPRFSRAAEFQQVRFGDRRWRDGAEGIGALLAPGFDAVRTETVSMVRRLTPVELWEWVDRMYDVHLLAPADRLEIRRQYIEALQLRCDADGRLDYPYALCRIEASAA